MIECRVERRGAAHWRLGSAVCCSVAIALMLLAAPAAAAAVRQRILALARQEIGYREPGNYCTIFGPCEEWCALFVTWVWRHAGVPVPHLAFTGYLYDWAEAATSVRGATAMPRPGDAVLFGTGPASAFTSRHVGIVEAVYPGYVVTIEGDSLHGVRRFVVPTRDPQSIGEPGPIYACASPVGGSNARDRRARVRAAAVGARQWSGGHPRRPPRRPSLEQRRLLRTIAALRAFQHMPYGIGLVRIDWTGVDSRGLVEVSVSTAMPVSYARTEWTRLLQKFDDAGRAYSVTFDAPPDPRAATG